MEPNNNTDPNTDPNRRLRSATFVQPLSELEPRQRPVNEVNVPAGPAAAPTARETRRPQPKRYYPWKLWLGVVGSVVVLAVLVGVAVLVFGGDKKPTASNPPAASTLPPAAKPEPTSVRLMATGDFIAHDSVNAAALKDDGTYNYLPLMEGFKDVFKKADVRYCNDPILNGGKQFGITGYPDFNSPTEFVRDMGAVGCNLVSTASNHTFDKTQEVVSASVFAWEGVPNMLAVAGQNRTQEERNKVHYFTVRGIKFAFLAYTGYTNKPVKNSFGVNMYNEEFVGNQIKQAKADGAQFIIVSMRWGTEYSGAVNAAQKAQAQFLADQGVQLVLGHGPHVLQPTQEVVSNSGNKTLVWYSLGNFLNTQIPPETLFNGVAVMDIDIKSKKITKSEYLPIYMSYQWTAQQAAAENLNARTKVKLLLLEDATQDMLNAQQLKTTIDAQKQRITQTLGANGLQIPLITKADL